MPIQSGAVTFARFRLDPPRARADAHRCLLRGLHKRAFAPLGSGAPDDDRAAGFVELVDHEATGFEGGVFEGEHALFAWRIDQRKVSAKAVKAEVDRWAASFVAEHGRPPGRREKAVRKEEVRQLLRGRAEPSSKVIDVSWNLQTGEVAVWGASRKLVDEIAGVLEEVLGASLRPVSVGATAARAGVPEAGLGPTEALFGVREEGVTRGAA